MPKRAKRLALVPTPDDVQASDSGEFDVLERIIPAAHYPVVVADARTARICYLSRSAAQLVGLSVEEAIGSSIETFAEDPKFAKRLLALLSDGNVDGYQLRRRLRRVDGSRVNANVWVRTIGPHPASMVLFAFSSPPGSKTVFPGLDIEPYLPPGGTNPLVSGWIDTTDHIGCISADVRPLLGYEASELIGMSVHELLPPEDAKEVARAVKHARLKREALALHVRGRRKTGEWRRLSIFLCPLEIQGRFGFLLTAVDETRPTNDRERTAQLERVVWRVAREIEAAGTLNMSDRSLDVKFGPIMAKLTARQWEILRRLQRGERVPQIAREMFISQSTARNHLATIFRQFDVHSQSELLELLRK